GRRCLRGTRIGFFGFQLPFRDQTKLYNLLSKFNEPPFVVAHAEIIGRGQQLDVVPVGIEIPLTKSAHRPGQCIGSTFPFLMKHRFILLVMNGAHVLHTAHVMHAVHARPPAGGTVTFSTPIIALRVTISASCSSVIFSVPEGRSGRTRYLNSAVLSHTRTSTSSGSFSPNSRSTPRGSMTARDR